MELGNVALMDAVKQEKITVSSFCSQRGVNGEGGRMLIGLERRFGVCQSIFRGNALIGSIALDKREFECFVNNFGSYLQKQEKDLHPVFFLLKNGSIPKF